MIPTTFKDQYISCKNKEQYLGDLLLIHGYCVEYSYFNAAKAVDELSKYFNVYLLDLPGHGTNKEGIVPEDMKLWRIADYIASYIEHKKLNNFYLMGHSMGGALVSLVTTKIPEKIKKLFLITPANPSAWHVGFKAFYIFFPKNMDQKNRLLKCLYAPQNYEKFSKNPEWVKMNQEQLQFQLDNWDNMKALYKELSKASLTYVKRAQKAITIPMVLMVGKYDRTIPAKWALKFFKKHHSEQQLKTYLFENSGHLIFEEEPELFVQRVLENCK